MVQFIRLRGEFWVGVRALLQRRAWSHRVAAACSAQGCPHGTELRTAHYFSIRNLRTQQKFPAIRPARGCTHNGGCVNFLFEKITRGYSGPIVRLAKQSGHLSESVTVPRLNRLNLELELCARRVIEQNAPSKQTGGTRIRMGGTQN